MVVRVEDHHRLPVGLEHPHLEAWSLKGALMEASIQEEEPGGNQEEACLCRNTSFIHKLSLHFILVHRVRLSVYLIVFKFH